MVGTVALALGFAVIAPKEVKELFWLLLFVYQLHLVGNAFLMEHYFGSLSEWAAAFIAVRATVYARPIVCM